MITVAANTVVPAPEHVTDATLWVRREFGPAVLSMGANLQSTSLLTCQERLQRARDAYEQLILGHAVQVVSHDGRTVTYLPGKENALAAYIRQLERECGDSTQMRSCGRARRMSWRV